MEVIGLVIDEPIPLINLTELKYSTYATNFNSGQLTWLRLYVDTNGDADWDEVMTFEPVYQTGTYPTVGTPEEDTQAAPVEGSWQTWDALNGGWMDFGEGTGDAGPPIMTIAAYLEIAGKEDARLVNHPSYGALRLATGCGDGPWDDFDGNVDGFVLGIEGVSTTYDFELDGPPAPPPSDDDDDDGDDDGDTAPPPPSSGPIQTFASSDVGAGTGGAITASGNPNVNITALVVKGEGNFAAVGDPNLISMGIVQAVDVFTYLPGGVLATVFDPPITICLQGAGTVYFRPAADQTGTYTPVPAFAANGSMCVTLSQPGLLVLVGIGATAPVAASAPATNGAATPLSDCQVTTDFLLRLRADSNTSSDILARLPMGTTVDATEMVDGWYRVVYGSQQGWVSADFVSTSGNCG